mmetsp:Transcript_60455/g.169454  ORF Transcript_60455/g.169454 Transcript_60455/m.169454 type:complete len:118 (-) Transcript_60455:158-511(-)
MPLRVKRTSLLLCLFLLSVATTSFGVLGQTTREEIIASREKRRLQLERVLEQINQKIADHQSGKKNLAKHQLEHMEHKIRAYQYQIEELDRELDEDEIQVRLERAAELQKARTHQEL